MKTESSSAWDTHSGSKTSITTAIYLQNISCLLITMMINQLGKVPHREGSNSEQFILRKGCMNLHNLPEISYQLSKLNELPLKCNSQ